MLAEKPKNGPELNLTVAHITAIANAFYNFDFDTLAIAEILKRDMHGNPAKGGSSWERFNGDPITFILKLPEDRLEKLVELINSRYK